MTNAKPSLEPIIPPVVCATPEETQALGKGFARLVSPGSILSLEGPLGAGKTQFVKGFAAAMGYSGEVSSPTFTLLHEYLGNSNSIIHFDWYRLDESAEVFGLGWEDYLESQNMLLIEWGDKFPQLLPAGTWRVQFEIQDDSRAIRWEQTL